MLISWGNGGGTQAAKLYTVVHTHLTIYSCAFALANSKTSYAVSEPLAEAKEADRLARALTDWPDSTLHLFWTTECCITVRMQFLNDDIRRYTRSYSQYLWRLLLVDHCWQLFWSRPWPLWYTLSSSWTSCVRRRINSQAYAWYSSLTRSPSSLAIAQKKTKLGF